MFLSVSRYWFKNVSNYTKTFICKILYKICSTKQIISNKYATNLKTRISQRSLRNSSLLLLLFEFNNFSFLIDINDNIIYASGTCHQNSNHWQCSIIVTRLRLYHVTSILHGHWGTSGHVIRASILHKYILV